MATGKKPYTKILPVQYPGLIQISVSSANRVLFKSETLQPAQ